MRRTRARATPRAFVAAGAVAMASLSLIAPVALRAQTDHFNLEEGLPTRLEDAYATAYRNRELQLAPRYDRQAEGRDLVFVDPALEVGLFRNSQWRLSVPVRAGSADRTGSGNVRLEGFYNFNTEGQLLPAIAVAARGEFPTGYYPGGQERSTEGTAKLIATKSVDNRMDRLHVNVEYTAVGNAMPAERNGRFAVAAGVSGRAGPDMVVILDAFRQEERLRGEVTNLAELGVRRQLTPRAIVAVGLGTGLDKDSPRVRGTLAFQRSF